MGQYYNIVIGNKNGEDMQVTDRKTADKPNEYVMAKLMEFAWLETPTSLSILTLLTQGPHRVAVIGDYANDDDWYADIGTDSDCYDKPNYDMAWNSGDITTLPEPDYEIVSKIKGKFIVNHTRHSYIDIDDYLERSTKVYSWCPDEGLAINPVILLTALGNGLGGGDYSYHDPVHVNRVGKWAWDVLEIVDEVPEDYKWYDIEFYENYKY